MDQAMNQWPVIQRALDKQRIPQAMMFVGAAHINLDQYTKKVLQYLFCKLKTTEPCLTCIDCMMVENSEHPDMHWVKAEKSGSTIKIDQIRELQNTAYLSPQRANYKVIIIDGVEAMNDSASNALLKILEEPAKQTIFILLARQIGNVLATIISRCQVTTFSNKNDWSCEPLFDVSQYTESDKISLLEKSELILSGFIELLEGQKQAVQLASEWTQYELANLLWFLYLVYTQIQYIYYFQAGYKGHAAEQLNKLAALLNPITIFTQLDKINSIFKKLSHNINMNHTLVLEDMLFSIKTCL